MIIKLDYTNRLPVPVVLRSNIASEQPLQPGQGLEMTFEMHEGEDGVAILTLVCEQAP